MTDPSFWEEDYLRDRDWEYNTGIRPLPSHLVGPETEALTKGFTMPMKGKAKKPKPKKPKR